MPGELGHVHGGLFDGAKMSPVAFLKAIIYRKGNAAFYTARPEGVKRLFQLHAVIFARDIIVRRTHTTFIPTPYRQRPLG